MAKISALTSLAKTSVGANDYFLIANTTTPTNYKILAQDFFPTLNTLGTSSESLFVNITNKNILNFKGIKSLNSLLTVATASNNITLQVNEANIDLANCDNTTSAFLSTVTLTTDVTGILPVANGGTGASTLTANSLILGNGTGAFTALGAATNGQLIIGRTGLSPLLATLTAGANVTITNGAGSITIAAALSTMTSNVDGGGYNLYNLGWLSGDGANEGIKIDSSGRVFAGSSTPSSFFTGDLNVNQDIYLKGGVTQYIKQADSSSGTSLLVLQGGSRVSSAGVGGGVRILGGDSVGANQAGGLAFYTGNHDGTGSAGNVVFYGYNSSATLQDIMTMIGATKRVGINNNSPSAPLDVTQTDSSANLPVVELEQLDTNESFINFVGTSGAASASSLSSSTASAAAKTGAIKVKINGTDAWIRVYATAE
jgi:hypothetical protein